MRRLFVAALVLCAGCGGVPSPRGTAAPPIDVELVQGPVPEVAGWQQLAGKVVVLEFWSTWCQPCVESIPHLNDLADKLSGKPVVFLSVSDEPRAKVAAFLKKTPMKAWVAADAAAAFSAFGVRGRPTTVIVGKDGRILARTFPDEVSVGVLEQALAGQAPNVVSAVEEPPPAGEGGLISIEVSTATLGPGSMSSRGEGALDAVGLPLGNILALACQVGEARVRLPAALARRVFTLRARFPSDSSVDAQCDAALGALEAAGSMRLERRARQTQVYLVRGGRGLLKTSGASMRWGGPDGDWQAQGVPLSVLLEELEARLGTPLVDQTGLTGVYDARVRWDPKKPGSLKRALERQLGLELTPARRTLELIEGRAAPPSKTTHAA